VPHIKAAVCNIFTSQVLSHALSEGGRAVTKFITGDLNLCFSFGTELPYIVFPMVCFILYLVLRTCALACQRVAT
jgi:hypothetical protein